MRLDKFVCKSTEYTKDEAIQLIHAGQLRVNGTAIISEAAMAGYDIRGHAPALEALYQSSN